VIDIRPASGWEVRSKCNTCQSLAVFVLETGSGNSSMTTATRFCGRCLELLIFKAQQAEATR
jgi:hypothetical protein